MAEPTRYTCTNCGDECPSGTLPNGLCSDCDMVGKTVVVGWGHIGKVNAEIVKVTKNHTVYARRWNKARREFTTPRQIVNKGGWWWLK